jgi:hypothetical protein
MKSVKELRQERAEKIAGMTRLNVAAEGEERDLTEAEKVEYDGLKTAAALLAERIARLEEAQELEEDVHAQPGHEGPGRDARQGAGVQQDAAGRQRDAGVRALDQDGRRRRHS